MKNKILKLLIILLIIGFILGLVKTELILSHLKTELVSIARITGYISVGISTVIYYFFIITFIIIVYNLLDIKYPDFSKVKFYKSLQYLLYFLILNEFIKIGISYYFIKDLSLISSLESFTSQISENWKLNFYITLSDLINVSIGTFCFIFFLKKNNDEISDSYCFSIILIMLFIFSFFRLF